MSTLKYVSVFNCVRSFVIVVLIGLLLPASSAFAQPPVQEADPEQFAKYWPADGQGNQKVPSNQGIAADESIILPITGNLLQDPSFESSFGSGAYWSQYSTNRGTPLCTAGYCGTGSGTAGPRTGSVWNWLGGVYFANPGAVSPEIGYVYQNVTFPSCGAKLEFYLWIGYAEPGSGTNDVFNAKIDGVTVFSANATQKNSYSSYKLVSINVNSFANGATHKVEFYSSTSNHLVNFSLDDASLIGTCPTISGNAGVAGATLKYTGGVTSANGSGNYSFNVPTGWSGTVTPSKSGYTFSPASRTYSNVVANQASQNYTATALFSISGDTDVAGVTLSYTDGTPKTVTSQANGNYSFTVLNHWNGTVTPTHACFNFSPLSRSYNNLGSNQTSQNYTPAFKAGSGCADINARIGSVNQGRFGLPAGASARASFAGVNGGPVKIVSNNGVPLIAAERVIYKVNGVNTSFTEMMGLPDSQLDKTYWLPWYNNQDLDTQLRFANVSGSTATVRVYISGQEKTSGCTPSNSPYTLAAGASLRVSCAGVNSGPVRILSTQNIVAAERVIYKVNGVNTSFSELLALPNSQLNTTYWLPWYDNVNLDMQLRIGNVSTSTATVRLFIGGQEKISGCTPSNSPYTLATGASLRVSCSGVNNGPVQIVSTQNIVAAERTIYKHNTIPTSYSEMMALPNSQTNTTFWLPWYNNVDLDTQLRIANVSGTAATVRVYIGGTEMSGSPFNLAAGASVNKSFGGINKGPVRIFSTQNIVVSERVIYRVNNIPTSFSEMMGLPNSQLATTYWLPWYNNVDLDTQLRFGVP